MLAPHLSSSSERSGASHFPRTTMWGLGTKVIAMSVNTIVRYLLACVALALASGCGGGSAVPQSPLTLSQTLTSSPPVMLPNANHYGEDFMFTAQLYGNDITVYKRVGFTLQKVGLLSQSVSAPQGSMATQNGYLYVSNGGDANILVYKDQGKKGQIPEQPLEDYGQFPNNVALTPDRNLVAVSNEHSSPSGRGSVSIYLNRQTEPTRLLTYGTDQLQGEGVAIDHQGNCFWSFNDPNTNSGSVVEFSGCAGYGSVIVSSIPKAGGIVFDQSGDLYYIDQTKGVYQCQKTSMCTLFFANGTGYKGPVDPVNLNFDYKQKGLWIADAAGYIWAVDLQGHGKCKHPGQAVKGGKGGKSLCVYRFSSVDGDPYGIAPEPG